MTELMTAFRDLTVVFERMRSNFGPSDEVVPSMEQTLLHHLKDYKANAEEVERRVMKFKNK
jgi:hypothetical protein